MTTTREQLIQGFREWAKDGMGVDDATIIPAERGELKGRRPPLPYITVDVLLHDAEHGQVEKEYRSDATMARRGTRRGTVSLIGYGDGSSSMIEWLALHADTAPDPLTVVPIPGLNDISLEVEGVIEERYQRDFTVYYAVRATRADEAEPADFLIFNDEVLNE